MVARSDRLVFNDTSHHTKTEDIKAHNEGLEGESTSGMAEV